MRGQRERVRSGGVVLQRGDRPAGGLTLELVPSGTRVPIQGDLFSGHRGDDDASRRLGFMGPVVALHAVAGIVQRDHDRTCGAEGLLLVASGEGVAGESPLRPVRQILPSARRSGGLAVCRR